MEKRVEVTISCGTIIEKKYELEYTSFEEFKTRLLKRFGNINGTNKGEKQRLYVKGIIKESESIESMKRKISSTTWDIKIREY